MNTHSHSRGGLARDAGRIVVLPPHKVLGKGDLAGWYLGPAVEISRQLAHRAFCLAPCAEASHQLLNSLAVVLFLPVAVSIRPSASFN